MEFGKLKLGEVVEILKPIAKNYGLNLSRIDQFKMAKLIAVNLYCHETQSCGKMSRLSDYVDLYKKI